MSNDSELELFQIKSKFLGEIPHPKLIWKAIVQTQQSSNISADEFVQSIKTEGTNLMTSLKNYLDELIKIKLQISNASTTHQLNSVLVELYKLHWSLLLCLASYMPEMDKYPDDDIKMSDSIDAYLLIKFLESNRLNENEIKTYICKSIENKLVAEFDVLTLACLRSRKISGHARSI